MPLTATKFQTANLLGVSDDTVENLLHQGRLRRTLGNRFVQITLESVAAYTNMPLEHVLNECRLAQRWPTRPRRTQADTRLGGCETVIDNGASNSSALLN